MIIFKSYQAVTHIAPYLSKNPVIVEAGAFTGHDTCRMAAQWPNGIIHAFEPVPALFKELVRRTHNHSNVICYPYALSNQVGTATFYISEKPDKPGIISQAGSLQRPKERLAVSKMKFPYTIEVQTTTLDAWAEQSKIKYIDFLWLDIQGHELSVLKAAPLMLKTVQAIYTEVGFIEAYEGQPKYEEIRQWLQSQGFKEVARDFINQTDWFFGNVLFVRG